MFMKLKLFVRIRGVNYICSISIVRTHLYWCYFRMSATAFHQAVGTLHSRGYVAHSFPSQENGIVSFRLVSKGFKMDIGLMSMGTHCSNKRRISRIKASASQTVFDQVSSPSNGTTTESKKKSSNSMTLILFLRITYTLVFFIRINK